MTMIAIKESNNFPLLWGDLLFSTTLSQDSEFIYPSYNINFDLPINGNIYPYRLMQKAYIIHPLIAIVCAGNLARMKRFIICIKDYFNTHEATIENLDLFISSYNYCAQDEAYGICIASPEHSRFEYRYLGEWKEKYYSEIGKIATVGSGSSDFLQTCDSFNTAHSFLKIDNYCNAISNVCMVLSSVLGAERYFASDIKQAWGAGFEIIAFDYSKNKFVKLDNINYIIWKAKFDTDEEQLTGNPISAMTYKYIGEALTISSHIGQTPTIYVVLPIYEDPEKFDTSQLTKPFVDSNRICNIYQIETNEGIIQPMCVFLEDNSSPQCVFLKYNEQNCFEIYCSQEFSRLVKDEIKLFFAKK